MEFFKGTISNCKKEVLTHTSGEIQETKIESKRNLWPFWDVRVEGGGGGGSITTTHEYYTDFEIDGVAFRCYGDLVFKDGDNVRLYAYKSSSGYYQVGLIKNFTRDFYVGPQVAKPTKDDDKNQKKSILKIAGTIIVSMIMGICYSFIPALISSIVIALIAWIFFDNPDLPFLAICIAICIVCGIVLAIASLKPESESEKQARKQQAQEQWTMYQNIINDN